MSAVSRPTARFYAGAAASAQRLFESGGAALAISLGLPLLAGMLWLNLSDVVARRTPIPSLLQPLILALAVAVILYRNQLQPRLIAATPLVLLAIVYNVTLIGAGMWTADPAAADERILEAVRGLIILLIAGSLGASWTSVRRAVAVIALCAALLTSLTLVQTLTGRFDIDFGGLARSERGHIYGDVSDVRAGGPVGDPNFYGQILLMAFPLAAFLGWKATRRRDRLVFLTAAAFIAAGAALTYSRGALLALAFVMAMTVVSLRVRPLHVIAVAIVALLIAPPNLTRRFLTLGRAEGVVEGVQRDSSVDRRKLDAATALRMFDHHPFFGVGTGGFSHHYRRYSNQVGSSAPQYDALNAKQAPHSLYLELAAETGLAGLITFAAMIAAAFVMLGRARRKLAAHALTSDAAIATALSIALAGYLISSIFLHGAFQRYLWLLLGLSAAVTRLASRESAASGPPEAA
jgi:O-antigen ligase